MTDRLGPYELDTIVTGDARELAKAIPDKSCRFAFCDPPYWVGFNYGKRTDDQMDFVDPAWIIEEMSRIADVACVTPGIGNLYCYPEPDWIMLWLKRNTMKRTAYGFNHWEPILCYGKPGLKPREQRPDVIEAPLIVDQSHTHACPKPTKLMRALLERFGRAGPVVDFMVGSGTTAVVAREMGISYLAFEIDPATAELARERVRNTQPPLPLPQPVQGELL